MTHVLATKLLESTAGKWHEHISGGWDRGAGKGKTTLSELQHSFMLVKGTM